MKDKKIDDEMMDLLLREHGRGEEGKFMGELEGRLDASGEQGGEVARRGWKWLPAAAAAMVAGLVTVGAIVLMQGETEEDREVGGGNETLSEMANANLREMTVDEMTDLERDLNMGVSLYDLGDFDSARDKFEAVVEKDGSNVRAREMLVKVDERIADYQASARDHTRTRMLREVDDLWETKVPTPGEPAIFERRFLDGAKDLRGFGYLDAEANGDGTSHEYLGRVSIAENDITQDLVIRREMEVSPGEIYSKRKFDPSRRRLESLGFYEGVDFGTGRSESLVGRTTETRDSVYLVRGGTAFGICGGEAKAGSRYAALVENRFLNPGAEESKFSTFAVDVDTASYTNLRGAIRSGAGVSKDSVRLEEILNYFDYDYAQPEGEHPFAVHIDSASCPWNEGRRLVRIGLQGEEIVRGQREAANLVFLLDVSGSMDQSEKLPLLRDSIKILVEELGAEDSVAIVVYAGESGMVLAPTKVTDEGRREIIAALDGLGAGGSTAGGEGIKLAYQLAEDHFAEGGINRIILGTDGDFNVGVSGTEELTEMVKEKAKSGVYLSVVGFGRDNLNDAMLESITNNGNGNYFFIDSIKEGRKVFLEDLMGTIVTIAKDVKVQVAFNPLQVKAYRLLGYSNRMLKAEDFRDKRVDAGEIGSGHSVTALYEIIPADGEAFGGEVDRSPFEKDQQARIFRKRDELVFVKLAYKEPEATTETESTYFEASAKDSGDGWKEASEDFKFASAAALFGLVLGESEFRGDGDLGMVRDLAVAGKGKDGKGERGEFIDLVGEMMESSEK